MDTKSQPTTLSTQFHRRGRIHHLVKRTDRIAVFCVEEPSGQKSYEVIIIDTDSKGNEAYPTAWGSKGWSFPNLLSANNKFYQLSK